jgi:phthiodiolone/phenolphthiodiolone dimycocerosates ketoreductase
VRIGVRVPPGPPSPRLERLIQRLVDSRVDSLWWGDHLMAFSSPDLWDGKSSAPTEAAVHSYADPFVVMAWCADIIGATAVGTCVTDAIRRMPASLAQTALTLDHLLAGTVILGLGAGEVANYRPYGWDVASPTGRLEEATRQIRGFFESSAPDANGAIVALGPPPGSPGPELWLAAHGPRGLRLVGEQADGWLPVSLDADEWTRARDLIRTAAGAAGRDPAEVTMGLSLDVVVQETRAEAVQLLSHPVIKQACLTLPPSTFARYGVAHPLGASAFSSLVPTTDGPRLLAAARAVPDQLVRDHVVHGTVDDVAAAICGYDGLEHVRLSDLSGAVRPGGGLDRLLAVVEVLRG